MNREFTGRGLLRAIFLIPYVVSAVAASFVWKWLPLGFRRDRRAAGRLGLTDRPINFIDNASSVLASLIVVNVWREVSFRDGDAARRPPDGA